jgi:gamma-glutamyl-gamma-aminobutyrate hydrolase PuuD
VTAPPRIGLASYLTQARFGAWEMPSALVPAGYVEGIRLAGGLPVVFPPTPEGAREAATLLEAVDGLVLIGGGDLGADLYGAEPHPQTQPRDELRDRFELSLLEAARVADMPVLGICRGMQLLNVASGGSLDQHLADSHDGAMHRPEPGSFATHSVGLESGTRVGQLLGDEVAVQSTHHQGIAAVGEGLVPAGRAPDGTVEAIEDPEAFFCVGVLWHPEEEPASGGAPLFRGVVEAARARRAARA